MNKQLELVKEEIEFLLSISKAHLETAEIMNVSKERIDFIKHLINYLELSL